MSLIPYEFAPNAEPMDYTPLVFGMGIALASMFINAASSSDASDDGPLQAAVQAEVAGVTTVEAAVQTNADDPSLKGDAPENFLDSKLLDILARTVKPLTARQLVCLLGDVDRKKVNSRLYTLYCKKKVKKCDTQGAPLWFV
jgi:hypothetical protein